MHLFSNLNFYKMIQLHPGYYIVETVIIRVTKIHRIYILILKYPFFLSHLIRENFKKKKNSNYLKNSSCFLFRLICACRVVLSEFLMPYTTTKSITKLATKISVTGTMNERLKFL